MQKCGMIKEDDDGHLRIKLYKDSNGVPKGDGTCCYFQQASVDLSTNILDGSEFRDPPASGNVVSVTKAKFEQKGADYKEWKPKKKKNKKKKTNIQAQNLSWQDWRDDVGAQVVIIKRLFDPTTQGADDEFLSDLKDEIEMECAKKGEVEKTTVFGHHPDAPVAIKFKDPRAADACVKVMNGRWFSQRQLEAELYDGKTDYSVGAKRETAEDQKKRVEEFGDWLELSLIHI
eukprot:TRINITY_DN7300_c0_g2_i4.p2 TRINITY_DN7300_c0_g2~~TRINITY_DN7300_c0_g2_i4.p2  ORF type:complete len:231 (-),score=99.84 TRINITY_DN7300_c0_g2_i4:141-833(-)